MAPTRPSAKKSKSKSRHHKKAASSKSPRQLLAEATTSLTQGDALAAVATAQQALGALSDNAASPTSSPLATALHDLVGQAHLELGDEDAARRAFLAAVAADEDGQHGSDKFLYLAQLSETGGLDSVRWFQRGAAVLRSELAALAARTKPAVAAAAHAAPATADEDEEELQARKHKLADVLCAVAEVYMTDLSWEADCEARSEALATEASLLAPDSAGAWQTVASVRVSQGRDAEARAALSRALAAWAALPPGDAREPGFPARVALVRLLLTAGMVGRAAEVAGRCVRDDDESVEMLYLGGYARQLLGAEKKTAAGAGAEGEGGGADGWRADWEGARAWLRRCLRLFAQQEYEDMQLREHAEELLGEIAEELGAVAEGEDGEDEEGWEDDNDDDDDDDDQDDDGDGDGGGKDEDMG